jgi:4-amino-4-deoxy-L-arabinose transferase-like glycosyltransferase
MQILRKHKTLILLTAILLLAAILRLYKISDYMTFLGDEGRDVLVVKEILSGNLTLLGPRSSAADFYYGPVYYYFITPFLWLFNYDPVGPAVFIALLGIVTVYLVFYVGKYFFGERAGLFAAALYTVSPLVIAYSRSSWNPNPLPFVSLLSIFCIYHAVEKKKLKYILFVGFLLGIAIQLQYLALFLILIVVFFLFFGTLLQEKRLDIFVFGKRYVLLAGGFLVGFSPFLAFEIKHGFPNLQTIFAFLSGKIPQAESAAEVTFFGQISEQFVNVFGRLVFRFPPIEQHAGIEPSVLLLWQISVLLLAIGAIFGLIRLKNRLIQLLFTLWLFLGVFLFGFYSKELYDYYLGFMFPLPFLLVGNMLSQLSKVGKFGIVITGVLFSYLFLFNLDANPFKFTPNRQKDQVRQISEFVLSKTDGKPYNFALITLGNSDHAYRYFFEVHNRPPVAIENPQIDPQRQSVTDQLLIVCEDPACQPLGNSLFEVAGFGRAEVAGEWNVSVVKVYRLVHFEGK